MQGFDAAKIPGMTPGMMSSANALWKMMDDMAAENPEEYATFMKEQLKGAQQGGGASSRVAEVPSAGFCVRLRLEGGAALFVNVCAHSRIKPPAANEDGSVPIAVSLPRALAPGELPATMRKKGAAAAAPPPDASAASYALDVVVSGQVTKRTAMDAGYREEIGALAAQCARDVMTDRRLLPRTLLPGYRVLASSDANYVGTPQPFVDAARGREPAADKGEGVSGSFGLGGGSADGLPAGFLEQLELSSTSAVEEEPEHELHDDGGSGGGLRLVVRLPRVAAVADLDLQMGERALTLHAEGLYKLRLDPLPRAILCDDAKCKFDKKRRVLTVTMPSAPPPAAAVSL